MIYLDHAASTPVDEKVLEEMLPYLKGEFGNPSSVHAYGRAGRAAIDLARERIAETLNADPKEIVFTSGGTEGVNAAHKGAAWAFKGKVRHVIISSIEHHCVLDCAEWLAQQGFSVTKVGPNAEGWIDPEEVQKAIRPGETGLISIMAANNEVGTIEPFHEIGALAREQGILFHTDAVQAYGKIPIDLKRDKIDFLSVSGHKIYGPKGVGFLYQRKGVELVPLIHGGGQERDRRGGTENVAGIVGLGAAAARICSETTEHGRLRVMGDIFLDELRRACPEARLNGPADTDKRLPGLLNITFPGIAGENLVHSLDAKGFAASSGAACAAGSAPPSHVLIAMGRTPPEAKQGLRLSFGRSNTGEQVRQLVGALPEILKNLKMMSSLLEDDEPPKKHP
ncbi:MAG TPA: cysteine desulfurase family protein [bacterium]|nr:cysteine desulfurase family protein [bacterium]